MMKYVSLLMLALLAVGCESLPLRAGTSGSPGDTTSPAGDVGAPAPSPSAALLEQSRSYSAAGEYSEAAASLERAVRIEPANPWLWLELARVHLATGNTEQAEAHVRKALSLGGTDVAVRNAAERLRTDIDRRQPEYRISLLRSP